MMKTRNRAQLSENNFLTGGQFELGAMFATDQRWIAREDKVMFLRPLLLSALIIASPVLWRHCFDRRRHRTP